MQPIVLTESGTIRFKENRIISYLLKHGAIDLNKIAYEAAMGRFTNTEQRQLAQLIGYSVAGYGDLPYACKHKSVKIADKKAAKLIKKANKNNAI